MKHCETTSNKKLLVAPGITTSSKKLLQGSAWLGSALTFCDLAVFASAVLSCLGSLLVLLFSPNEPNEPNLVVEPLAILTQVAYLHFSRLEYAVAGAG